VEKAGTPDPVQNAAPPATRNIDPLSDEGIDRAARRAAAIAAAAPPTQTRTNPAIVRTVASNRSQLGKIDEAIAALKKNPSSVGLRGLIPNILLQRMDTKGNPARNAISDVGSLVIHDRSGAAVSAAEMRRLNFIPLDTDTPQNAMEKLERFKRWLIEETDFLQQAPADADNATPGSPQTPNAGPSERARAAVARARGAR
jgi:hypothetical protein